MKEHMDLGLPEKLELQEFPDYMRISRKWFSGQVIFMTVFAIFWNGFLWQFYADMGEEADVFSKIFPLIHVAAGIGISYYAIAGWFNKSNVFVSKETIEINHKPIPWFGNKKMKSADLKQIYTKEKVTSGKNGTTVTYEVHAILNSGTNTKLLSGLEASEQALYIEQEIEKYLNIKNSPVRGAVG
ncbi:MAG: hypothetical protein ABJH06_06650 [Paraglaciecola sp.]|uniref:hypothetical protein n=1 Tax=Paraglaciecola sp. TaxID=1920173 RepID=UPI003262E368